MLWAGLRLQVTEGPWGPLTHRSFFISPLSVKWQSRQHSLRPSAKAAPSLDSTFGGGKELGFLPEGTAEASSCQRPLRAEDHWSCPIGRSVHVPALSPPGDGCQWLGKPRGDSCGLGGKSSTLSQPPAHTPQGACSPTAGGLGRPVSGSCHRSANVPRAWLTSPPSFFLQRQGLN